MVFPELVSFGDIYIGDRIYPASVVENDPWQVLLVVDYAYPNEWVTFLPIMLLSLLFMFLLYLVIWKFLQPISLMQNRIVALEAGDLDSQIHVIGNDELALLSQNFNVSTYLKYLETKWISSSWLSFSSNSNPFDFIISASKSLFQQWTNMV